MPNMQNMLKQAQQMQQRMQEEVAKIRVEATAGGGMVTINMDGQKMVLGVKIDPEVAGDVEMLQDMVMAAIQRSRPQKWTSRRRKSWAAWVCLPDCSSRQGNKWTSRAAGAADPEFKRLPGVGQKSAQRIAFFTYCGPSGTTPSVSRRRSWTSKTSLDCARSATTSATARCARIARIRTAIAGPSA